jgi:hypothetical protein
MRDSPLGPSGTVSVSRKAEEGTVLPAIASRRADISRHKKKGDASMRYQWVGLTLLTGVTVFFQGCASIVNHDRPVGITSQPSGAAIAVYNKKGEAVYEA